MEEPIREEEPKPYKMAKLAYEACMDTEALEVCSLKYVCFSVSLFQRIGLAPLKLELEKLGGWPLLQGDSWREDQFSWYNRAMFGGTQLVDLLECFIFFRHNLASMLMKNGHQWDHVLNIYPMPDAKNSSWRVLVMDGVKLKAPPQTEYLQKIREVIQVGGEIFGMFSGGCCCPGRKTQSRPSR